jgi:tetratricopeptide (TPR) repeat protein
MADASVVLGELAEVFTRQVRQGELPDIEAFARQHPELAERIRELFPTLLVLEGLAGAAGPSSAPGTAAAPDRAGTGLAAGAAFGGYRIEREVGRGGMGIVYEAVHVALRKRVALKVLPIGGPQEAGQLERFLREARTAAGLHHTNIVPVFDIGQVSGTPYYAMQFIEGAGLDRVLEQRPADSSEAALCRWVAELGVQAAEGLAYAHQRGVIHRDIKPSNLLLDQHGVLWITDFGLARRKEDPALTLNGTLVGTPRYMSPEQAEATRRPVDHRTDVYSLGATLYELLARRPAFEGRTPQEVVTQILDRDPLAPRRHNPAVPRDLETIVLKAMAKRPEDRYPSARDLAEDLRRWLRLEPVRARRIGLVGRAVRWGRRNPALAGLTATLLTVVTVGLLGVLFQWRMAEVQRERALAAEQQARRNHAEAEAHLAQAQHLQEAVDHERAQAEANYHKARQAVDDYFTRVAENWLQNAPGQEPLRRQLLEDALRYYQRFIQERADDPALRAELAAAYQRVAQITRQIGRHEDALAAQQRAQTLYEHLVRAHPTAAGYQASLAASQQHLGELYRSLGQPAEAEQALRQAVELQQKLVREQPAVPEYQNQLAQGYSHLAALCHDTGRRNEAELTSRRALTIWERLAATHPAVPEYRNSLAASHCQLASLAHAAGRLEQAEAAYRQALTLQEKLALDRPTLPLHRQEIAGLHQALGELYAATDRRPQAEEAQHRALALRERLVRDHPAVLAYQRDLALSYRQLGLLQLQTGRHAEALRHGQQARALQEKLVHEHPNVVAYRSELARTFALLGRILTALGRGAEGSEQQKYLDQAVETLRRALELGYADVEQLRKDPDLAPLRAREDFPKLLNEGRERAPPGSR